MKPVRVCYAAKLTEALHIGKARMALFNFLYARQQQGSFIIRIEDLNLKGSISENEKSQLENLAWLGIEWDESPDKTGQFGPYRQTERQDIYRKFINLLIATGRAYKDFTSETVESFPEEYVVRFKIPQSISYDFTDIVKGRISFESNQLGPDFIIQKSNGLPTTILTSVVDDHLMAITHVLKEDEHLPTIGRQLMLYDTLGWSAPQFGHLSIIRDPITEKNLSKENLINLQCIEDYRKQGYPAQGLLNFMSRFGWMPPKKKEIFSLKELITHFDLWQLNSGETHFDSKRLAELSHYYLKKIDLVTLTNQCYGYLVAEGILPSKFCYNNYKDLKKIVAYYQPHMSHMGQITSFAEFFFTETISFETGVKHVLHQQDSRSVLEGFKTQIENLSTIDHEQVNLAINKLKSEVGISGQRLFLPIRASLSGKKQGLELSVMIVLLGKKRVLERVNQQLAVLK